MNYNDKIYLNTDEVAEFIGRTPGAVRNLVLRNNIPYRKPGGRLLFIKKEIEEWIEGPSFQIDKDIPVPDRDCFKYPFRNMDVGDSFFVPLNGKDPIRVANNVNSSQRKYARDNHVKFAVRYMKNQGGVRCWRTA